MTLTRFWVALIWEQVMEGVILRYVPTKKEKMGIKVIGHRSGKKGDCREYFEYEKKAG